VAFFAAPFPVGAFAPTELPIGEAIAAPVSY